MIGEEDSNNRPEKPGKSKRIKMPAFVGAGLWTLTAKIVSQVAQLLAFLIAARVLESAQFGFYAYSSAIAILLVLCAEGGWGEYVMKSHCTGDELDQIGTIAVISGLLCTGVGFALSIILHYWGDPWLGVLIALYSCWFLPSSLSVVYDGLLVNRGQLKQQSIIRIIAECLGLAVTIAGLHIGFHVASLIVGRLVMQTACLIGSQIVVRWYPRVHLTRAFLLEILEFSRHILSNRIIFYLRSYSGTLALGSFLGLAEAGYYRAAERIVGAISELLGEPARMLAWTAFRKIRNQQNDVLRFEELGRTATHFMTALMIVSAPVYIGLALVSPALVDIALGDAWAPTAALVSILAIKQVLLIPGYVTEPLLSITGNIARMPRQMLLNGVVAIGLIVAAAPFGVEAAAFGQCVAALISLKISTHLQGRYGGLDWKRVFSDCGYVFVAILAMSAIVYAFGYIGEATAMTRIEMIAFQVLSGAVTYFAALGVMHRIHGGVVPIWEVKDHPKS